MYISEIRVHRHVCTYEKQYYMYSDNFYISISGTKLMNFYQPSLFQWYDIYIYTYTHIIFGHKHGISEDSSEKSSTMCRAQENEDEKEPTEKQGY